LQHEIKDLSMDGKRDEGVIKFKLTLRRAPAPEMASVIAIEKWRALFFKLGLIGEYPNENIGYGNLSSRLNAKSFLITGSQTGRLPHLQAHHYTRVIACDLQKGLVTAEGLIPPSSESLTHYGIYEANSSVRFVFHVHHDELWQHLISAGIDEIPPDIAYGTVEMAEAARSVIKQNSSGILVMRGHSDGIISYGETAEEAGRHILETYRKLSLRQ
jgi:ribulose-5-phosphate 4-epimerase/fuculose-1-phosphate aldolase